MKHGEIQIKRVYDPPSWEGGRPILLYDRGFYHGRMRMGERPDGRRGWMILAMLNLLLGIVAGWLHLKETESPHLARLLTVHGVLMVSGFSLSLMDEKVGC